MKLCVRFSFNCSLKVPRIISFESTFESWHFYEKKTFLTPPLDFFYTRNVNMKYMRALENCGDIPSPWRGDFRGLKLHLTCCLTSNENTAYIYKKCWWSWKKDTHTQARSQEGSGPPFSQAEQEKEGKKEGTMIVK